MRKISFDLLQFRSLEEFDLAHFEGWDILHINLEGEIFRSGKLHKFNRNCDEPFVDPHYFKLNLLHLSMACIHFIIIYPLVARQLEHYVIKVTCETENGTHHSQVLCDWALPQSDICVSNSLNVLYTCSVGKYIQLDIQSIFPFSFNDFANTFWFCFVNRIVFHRNHMFCNKLTLNWNLLVVCVWSNH